MSWRAAALAVLAAGACGGSAAPASPAAPAAEDAPAAASPARPPPLPAGPWWHADTPQCAAGEVSEQSLTWGRVVWCGEASSLADRRHRNELGRVARCVRDATSALQSEPDEGALAVFVRRALEAGVAPSLCGAVRLDAGSPVASTHDGREVEVHRRLVGEDLYDDGGALLRLRYRFSCRDCDVFAETDVQVAVGPGEP